MAERSLAYLTDVGMRWPARLLVEQSDALLELTKKGNEAVLLASKGFPAARLDELKAVYGRVQAHQASQRSAKEDVPAATATLSAAFLEAKGWQRELVATVKSAFEEEGHGAVDAFLPRGAIGRSVPRMAEYLTQVLPVADGRADELESWGFGEAERQRGRALLAAITGADATQEAAKANLPRETAAFYAEKGRLYGLLKKLVRAGKRAHGHEGADAAAYNLNILKREYQPKAKQKAPAASPS